MSTFVSSKGRRRRVAGRNRGSGLEQLGLGEHRLLERRRGLGEHRLLDMAGERGLDEASGGLKQLEPFGRARQWFYGVAQEGATGSWMVRRLCRRERQRLYGVAGEEIRAAQPVSVHRGRPVAAMLTTVFVPRPGNALLRSPNSAQWPELHFRKLHLGVSQPASGHSGTTHGDALGPDVNEGQIAPNSNDDVADPAPCGLRAADPAPCGAAF